jgi:CHAT domain-containing protein/Tfp pilus assembly protein PilF
MRHTHLTSRTARAWPIAILLPVVASGMILPSILSVSAQTTLITDPQASVCPDLKPGIVVESVAKNSEGEKAGLVEGDVILGWSRGEGRGEFRSPFDLFDVETEQKPRGPVTLQGMRGRLNENWTLGPDDWGLATRPNVSGSTLTVYREGLELARKNKLPEATGRWRVAAARVEGALCAPLSSWFLLRGADLLADARQWKHADALYKEALTRARSERAGSEITVLLLLHRAREYQQPGDFENAEKYQLEALAEIQKSGAEKVAAANVLRSLGKVEYDRGDLAKAQEYFQQSLAIGQRLSPDSIDVAGTLNNLGSVISERGDIARGEEYCQQALEIAKKHYPDSLILALSLSNLGNMADDRGDLAQAEDYYHQALAIREKLAPDSLTVAFTLNTLGIVAWEQGALDKAEQFDRQGLAIRQKLAPGGLDVATSFGSLGDVAYARGNLAEAEDYYRRALAIHERLAPNSLEVANNLSLIGGIARERGDPAKAENYYRQALAIREKQSPGSLDVAYSFNNFGLLASERGDWVKAEEYYRQALVIQEKLAPGSLEAAESLHNLGEVASSQGDLAKAERYYRQAAAIQEKLAPNSVAHAESLAALASTMRRRQQPDEAALLYGKAIDVFDRQLATLGGSGDIRAGFRAQHENYYFEYADLLLEQKKPEQAFQVIEQSRARTLLETLAEAHVDVRNGVDPALLEKEHSLRATLTAKTNRKINLLEGEHTDEQVAAVGKEIEEVLAQYKNVEGQIRFSSSNYAGLTQPRPLSASEVQKQLLDADTILLDFVLGNERSHVFLVGATSLNVYELTKRVELEGTARHLYELVTAHDRSIASETSDQRRARLAKYQLEYDKTATLLSRMVLAPLADQIEGKRLLIVADGTLQYIPFGMLPLPGEEATPMVPLLAEHEIINLPSASVLAVLRRQAEERSTKPTKEVAVLADPVFDKHDPRVAPSRAGTVIAAARRDPGLEQTPSSSDEHLTRSLEDVSGTRQGEAGLSRLPFSRREAAAIMAVTKEGEGMEALDFAASRETATSRELEQYRIVHFATHGLLDNEHPELSGLVLSLVGPDGNPRDGYLDLEDVYNLTLSSDLVVLSACETGLGKEVHGEGLIGLTRGFMYAGASRVVASLWNVDDIATSELMSEFYKAMLRDGRPPAAALRQAQLAMWKQKRWSDPYYWAAFTIQGEWK